MTSDCNEKDLQEFDFCFTNDGDAKWYKDTSLFQVERSLKAVSGSLLGGERTTRLCKDIEFHLAKYALADSKKAAYLLRLGKLQYTDILTAKEQAYRRVGN